MRICHIKDCQEELTDDQYGFCSSHRKEMEDNAHAYMNMLADYRTKDPFYFQDLKIFSICCECIQPREDEIEDFEEYEEMYWVENLLYRLLFEQYYLDQNIRTAQYISSMNFTPGSSRTVLIMELIKEIKKRMYSHFDTKIEMKDAIHVYECCTQFLKEWIKEQDIIDKNLLTHELPLVSDLTEKMVNNIVTKL